MALVTGDVAGWHGSAASAILNILKHNAVFSCPPCRGCGWVARICGQCHLKLRCKLLPLYDLCSSLCPVTRCIFCGLPMPSLQGMWLCGTDLRPVPSETSLPKLLLAVAAPWFICPTSVMQGMWLGGTDLRDATWNFTTSYCSWPFIECTSSCNGSTPTIGGM